MCLFLCVTMGTTTNFLFCLYMAAGGYVRPFWLEGRTSSSCLDDAPERILDVLRYHCIRLARLSHSIIFIKFFLFI